MSVNKNLIWFNKEGDCLNFKYNEEKERYEGNILFHENSTDTFKTYGLYLFEKIPSFEFESKDELTLKKFQLFNEYGIHIYGSKYNNEKVDKIEPTNNDVTYYSKWIYGNNFEKKFPIGTHIIFKSPIFEFTNLIQHYVVVSSKKNAIMIISNIDNETFETLYSNLYNDANTYNDVYIAGINTIGIYNYVDSSFNNNLSPWSEPNFYDDIYIGRKLNIINSPKNKNQNYRFKQKIVTIKNDKLNDNIHYEYETPVSSLSSNSKVIIEVITKTDLPLIYTGGLEISSNAIKFINQTVPKLLKPGRKLKLVGSNNNISEYTVDYIPYFNANNQQHYYATHSLVIWNNKIYECILAYTQSGVDPNNSEYWNAAIGLSSGYEIDPDNTTYWKLSNYIPIVETLIPETLLYSNVYLATDKLYYEHEFIQNSTITLASLAEKYSEELKLLNIDLYYKNNKLKADLIYPTKYAIVNTYHSDITPSNLISTEKKVYEKLIEVEEILNTEFNYDISKNYNYNIVFTDLDDFGLIIKINKMVYQEEIQWVYSGLSIDMERTIDKTLRKWIIRHTGKLLTLGIIPELQYIGSYNSVYYNSIKLRTEYPNVPLEFEVIVGETADFYIEHSVVIFNDMGNYFNAKINNKNYGIFATYTGPNINIPLTLKNWCDEYSDILKEYGIFVKNINNALKFDLKKQNKRLDYIFSIGKSSLPGSKPFKIIKKYEGNVGLIITSNETKLPVGSSNSFIDVGFSTGMVFSINNTIYPFNNQEYVILSLNNHSMIMSYEGPFWGLTGSTCSISPYVNIAFDLGFGQTACPPSVTSTYSSNNGPFNPQMFNSNTFTYTYTPNNYSNTTYNLNNYNITNLTDIIYVQLSNSIYVLGDNIAIFDAYSGEYINTIILPLNTQSIKMLLNPVNSYLYVLTNTILYVIDPQINEIIHTINLIGSPNDIVINTNNGDVYISYNNIQQISIFNSSNAPLTPITPSGPWMNGYVFNMVYNSFENDIYAITNDTTDIVLRIDGNTRNIQTAYNIAGLSSMLPSQYNIYYEPVNESIYVWGINTLYKIDNNTVTAIPAITTQNFNSILFNNINDYLYISNNTNNIIKLDLDDNIIYSSNIANYGYMELNQFEGNIYISSQNTNMIIILNPDNGSVVNTITTPTQSKKIIYNPQKKNMWTILPGNNSIMIIDVELNILISQQNVSTYSTVEGYNYGTLDPDYIKKDYLWLKTREHIRRPKENYTNDVRVIYYYRWLTDNVPEIFLYDISGTQLETTGVYAYKGPKPLKGKIFLNRKPNRDINKVYDPSAQQTVFDRLYYTLEYIDEPLNDIFIEPEPIQTFIGFNSPIEGSIRSILQLYKRENISFEITSSITNDNLIVFKTITNNDNQKYGEITLVSNTTNFIYDDNDKLRGLKKGQLIRIDIYDKTNKKKQYISKNNGMILKIKEVYNKKIILDFLNQNDIIHEEETIIQNYPKFGNTTYLSVRFTVIDREIARFNVLGQTEEEDIRFKIELNNIGKNIGPEEVFIFKDYDINEGGTDWIYLNRKRKELLMQKHLIYPYIGSYKSIINAINFFGYNDLELYEYYRNINENSENFNKLFKIEIPDIFDNTVEGWKENDFIKHTFPNENYETTNLFNLTYKITNKEGTNILIYSLREVQIKLQGLKHWLERNIIPLTHKILDITGRADFVGINTITHRTFDIKIFNIKETFCPVTFKLNEAYLMPINNGSTQYNCVLDFYILKTPLINSKYTTFEQPSEKYIPEFYTIKIRTYRTYEEWVPFKTYNKGDRVIYYNKLYESVIDSNKTNNPRKYENAVLWKYPNINLENFYVVGQIYKYNNEYYVYTGLSSSNTTNTQTILTPNKDPNNWLNITEWKEINYEPVQTINEYRTIDNLKPFNFVVDTKIDPFIVIEVFSHNGYGMVYADKKNYELRGLIKMEEDKTLIIEHIKPFKPIQPILNKPD